MKKNIALVILLVAVIALVAVIIFWPISTVNTEKSTEQINVIVSILPQKEFVNSVGGSHVIVKELIPPGASPATYDLSPKDLIAIENADIYFRIGHVPFEKAHVEQIKDVNPDLIIIDTSESVPLREFSEDEEHGHGEEAHEDEHAEDDHEEDHDEEHDEEGHHHEGVDPHIWLSPPLVKLQVESIYDALVDLDSANTDEYRANADAYISKLDSLDAEIKGVFEDIDSHVLMVFHPAWGYFADAYGLEQIAIEQEGKEPTASQLQEIIDLAKNESVKVIFVQAQFDKSIAESVAEEIGAVVVQIDPLAENYVKNLEVVGKTISSNL
jgi:zinc transport system substrate-binding protein